MQAGNLQQKKESLQRAIQKRPAKCREENADRNAAFNIAYRALGYISKVGVTVNMPKLKLRTFASADRNAMMTKATYFNR